MPLGRPSDLKELSSLPEASRNDENTHFFITKYFPLNFNVFILLYPEQHDYMIVSMENNFQFPMEKHA